MSQNFPTPARTPFGSAAYDSGARALAEAGGGGSGAIFTGIGSTGGISPGANYASQAQLQVSLYDWVGYEPGLSDQTQNIQDFLFWAQRLYTALRRDVNGQNPNLWNDQMTDVCGIRAIVPNRFYITCPLIVPTQVEFDAPTGVVAGVVAGGTKVSAYGGVPSAQPLALANGCFPMLMVPPGATFDDLVVEPNGVCSGVYQGKNWVPTAATLQNAGAGYSPGNVLIGPQPDKQPFVAFRITVNTVDGAGVILTYTLSTAGVYSAPGPAQARYWTTAYGYAGPIAATEPGTVFDSSGNYITSGGDGTGATFSLTWKPDFAGGGADFDFGNITISSHYHFKRLRCDQVATINDLTYGKSHGYYFINGGGGDMQGGPVETYGGQVGIRLYGDDMVFGCLNPVKSGTCLRAQVTNLICTNVRLDTWSVSALELDFCDQIVLVGYLINNPTLLAGGTVEPIQIGSHMASGTCSGINLKMVASSFTRVASTAVAKLAYIRESVIEVQTVNYNEGPSPSPSPYTSLFNIGNNFDKSNVLRGAKGPLVQTTFTLGCTLPSCTLQISNYSGFLETTPIRPEVAISNASSRGLFNQATSGNAPWKTTSSGSPTMVGGQTGPYGRKDAALWTLGTADTFMQAVTAAASVPIYVEGVFAPNATATQASLQIADAEPSPANFAQVSFNFSAGTVAAITGGGTNAVIASDVELLPNGYYRCWMTGTVNAANPLVGVVQTTGQTGSIKVHSCRSAVSPNSYPPVWAAYTPTVAASTSAVAVTYSEFAGQIFRVSGVNGAAQFTDVILASPGITTVDTVSSVSTGSPPARNYVQDVATNLGAINLTLASGTSTVTTQEIGDTL